MANITLFGGESVTFSAGTYAVFDTQAGAETVNIGAGSIVVLNGFNGGDTVRLTGNAADYTVVRDSSSVRFTTGTGASAITVTVPVSMVANNIAFNDVTRSLVATITTGGAADITLSSAGVTQTLANGVSTVVTAGSGGVTPPPPVAGQTFLLTAAVDTLTGTAGNDRVIGLIDVANPASAPATFTALDSIDGGAGTDTLRINAVSNFLVPAGATVTNVERVEIAAALNVGAFTVNNAGDISFATAFAGVTDLTVISGTEVDFRAPTTAAVNVSGVTGGVEVVGGTSQTVSTAQGGAVQLSGATGAISVTSSAFGTNGIVINGGSTVTTVSSTAATAAVTTGNITIGAITAPTDAVSVTRTLAGNGAGAVTQGNTTLTGGTTVNLSSTIAITAADPTNVTATTHTFGAVSVTGSALTTSVTANQVYSETEATRAAVAAVRDTHTVTFGALAATQTTTVNGLTFTASRALTAAEVAQAFSNLTQPDFQSAGGRVANGVFTGNFNTALFTSGAANGAVVVFSTTGTAAPGTVLALASTGATALTDVIFTGTAPVAALTSDNVVAYNTVAIANGAGLNTITSAVVNGYAAANLGSVGVAGGDLNALTALTLANSLTGATAALESTAVALGLTVNNIRGTVDLGTSVKTLNLSTTGTSSTFGLINSTGITTLAVAGSTSANISGSINGLDALTTVTVSGTAGLTLQTATGANIVSDTLTSVNTTGTTGSVTSAINGTLATYTGGAGVDSLTLLGGTALTKAISLGAGDDRLTLGVAVTGSTAALSGGDGVDTLSLSAANAVVIQGTKQAFITEFERVELTGQLAVATAINLSNLGFTNFVTTTGNTALLTLTELNSNGTVIATGDALVDIGVAGALANTADVVNFQLNTTGNAAATVTAANVETVNISTSDTQAAPQALNVDTLTLTAAAATTLNVTVGASTSLNLTLTGSTAVTTINASASTGALTVSTMIPTGVVTVTGGAGADVLTSVGAGDVLIGGAGNDILTGDDRTTLTGGLGNDSFVLNRPTTLNSYSTVTDATAGDVFRLTAGTAFVSAAVIQGGNAVFQDFANAAANMFSGINGGNTAGYFQFNGNTYIVRSGDVIANNGFVDGVDSIIEIRGLLDLSVASYNQTQGFLEIA